MGLSMFRKIQNECLQHMYNNPDDRILKFYKNMISALTFVPPDDVKKSFEELRNLVVDALLDIIDYLDVA